MSASQPGASIDLWDFLAHVRCGRYADAHTLIADGQEPYLFRGADDPDSPIWRETFEEFREARAQALAAIEATSGRRRSMLAARERLLSRSLVPGVGPRLPIREMRTKLESLRPPWTQERSVLQARPGPLPQHLAQVLSEDSPTPSQVIVVGGSGAGKTLTAISTFLNLTDQLGEDVTSPDVRTVLYVDPETEGSQPEFGTDAWLERRMRESGAEGGGRPIVVMPHGDVFLASRQDALKTTLDSSLFRDHDILICCGTQFYSRRLCYEDFGTHVIHLEPWGTQLQRSFAGALAGSHKCDEFEDWLKQDTTRKQLCSVPLHLVHVLSLLGEDSEALDEISTPPQLFEGVARMRLRVARCAFDEDQVLQDLAGLAHRFYVDATPSDAPIRFSTEEMKVFLRGQGRKGLKRRVNAMTNDALLTLSPPGSDSIRFEDPSWGWFFVARHLVHTVLYRPGETLRVFSKLLSAGMAGLCEEMLAERQELYGGEIYSSLRLALHEGPGEELDGGRLAIARSQVGYLLGALGGEKVCAELAPLVEPGTPAREPNHLVRRGIALGLADGGAGEFGDMYVEALVAEREAGVATTERDANVGFLLSSRGDQGFDPEHPEKIGGSVDPIRTVGDLLGELDDPRHCGSWRIKLYTLVDLSRHPAIPERSFALAFAPHRERAEEILGRLEGDDRRREWPETAGLRELMSRSPIGSPR